MASHFCEHGYMYDCPYGCDVQPGCAAVMGDNVPKLGVQSLVPKGRTDKDVKWVINPETGHREKGYFNWGLGKYCFSVKDTEKKAQSTGRECGSNVFD